MSPESLTETTFMIGGVAGLILGFLQPIHKASFVPGCVGLIIALVLFLVTSPIRHTYFAAATGAISSFLWMYHGFDNRRHLSTAI